MIPQPQKSIFHKSCVYISSDDDEPSVEPPVEPQPVSRLSRIRLSSATKRKLEKKEEVRKNKRIIHLKLNEL